MNDEPTMSDEQFEAFMAAFEQLRVWYEEAWQAIVDALQPLLDFMARTWREFARLHLVPRQYRDTMARRKIRRYALAYARRR